MTFSINKLEYVQATNCDPNFSILKIHCRKKLKASKACASKTCNFLSYLVLSDPIQGQLQESLVLSCPCPISKGLQTGINVKFRKGVTN